MAMNMLQELTVVALVLFLAMASVQQARGHRDSGPSRRHRRNTNNDPTMTNTAPFIHYTPSTPSPQDINCYVEVPTTQRTGGRCIQLGVAGRRSRNRPWACQAGVHLAFSPDCPNVSGRGRRGGRG